jgi:hypothetical protein
MSTARMTEAQAQFAALEAARRDPAETNRP